MPMNAWPKKLDGTLEPLDPNSELEAEMEAIRVCVLAFAKLGVEARRRVYDYLTQRFPPKSRTAVVGNAGRIDYVDASDEEDPEND